MKKLIVFIYFSCTLTYAQESAIDYFISNKDGYIADKRPVMASAVGENYEEKKEITPEQQDIQTLKAQILSLQRDIKNFESKEYDKNKILYASCITSVPYLEMDLQNINSQLSIYEKAITTIKQRNLLKNKDFENWFNLYNGFLLKQNNISIDISQISQLKTTNIVDFILSAISGILSNNKATKDLIKSSSLMVTILNNETSFYNNFETQIESKYISLSSKYNQLSERLTDYKKGKKDIIPQSLIFDSAQKDSFVENLNNHYYKLYQTKNGLDEIRNDKITFFTILQKYLSLKEDLREINYTFSKISDEKPQSPDVDVMYENMIETQLSKIYLILHGL
jgi:hypothetical protein